MSHHKGQQPEIVLSMKNFFSIFCKQDGKLWITVDLFVNLQRQESEDEWLTKLDKRIERARARHELRSLTLEWEPFFLFITHTFCSPSNFNGY